MHGLQRMIASAVALLAALAHPGAHAADAAPAATPATTPAALPPVQDFFSNPQFSTVQLSPSGRYLAAKLTSPNGRERLAVVDLSNNSALSVASFHDTDVGQFAWVNDERLLLDTVDMQVGVGDARYGPGLYAVNRDGSQFRQLASRRGDAHAVQSQRLLPWHTYMLGQRGTQDSDQVYVLSRKITGPGQMEYADLLQLNTKTGYSTTLKRPGDTHDWLLDSKGEPRLATVVENGRSSVHYRDPATGAWRELGSFGQFTGGKGSFRPLAFAPDGTLYVVTSAYRDKSAVHSYDLATGKINPQPLVELEHYDFSGRLIMSQDKLLGVRYLADAQGTRWLDPAMQAIQQEVDKLLPNTLNLLTPPSRPETPNLLVESYSDVQPRVFMLYNSANRQLSKIGASRPQIRPGQMGKQDLVTYAARDGLQIPAWLTLPHGKDKNLPMVVLVHGGPFVRGGQWGWRPDVQFLASRGYAVLEPEYRGSTGFGEAHFKAGWKQWGLKMQDDIADGTRWAIAQGIADGKRICIAGASYGGYATLMGLVNNPELYQCGVEWAGVTDIKLMYTGHWSFQSDLPDAWKQYGMPHLIGDPEKDAEQLKATSPLEQAARIRQPLLLAYGGSDMRMPLYHGKKFRDAVQKTNRQVEWVEYEEEGHGWVLQKNRYDFWTRVEGFLNKHIGSSQGEK
ncbi:S9 family peptidase [Pseudoduganella aquatica]|uniref:Prolyl oligopeptidase family serine peptidase n=1 Tax=Pseudoduganella aquatica TaxID=2660641 RepID=A0A7X4KJV2_9BURK|nr:alpha/beta fold hydrolase [Pseudoduganella aquatica]MYN06459.1 prolyl oligopeptidase family serine peptidase [Pseudoduganella aquatica]